MAEERVPNHFLKKDLQNKTADSPDLEVGKISETDDSKIFLIKNIIGSVFLSGLIAFIIFCTQTFSVSVLSWIAVPVLACASLDGPLDSSVSKNDHEKQPKKFAPIVLTVGVLEFMSYCLLEYSLCSNPIVGSKILPLQIGCNILFRLALQFWGHIPRFGSSKVKMGGAVCIMIGCLQNGSFSSAFLAMLLSACCGSVHVLLLPYAFSACGRDEKSLRVGTSVGAAASALLFFLSLSEVFVLVCLSQETVCSVR